MHTVVRLNQKGLRRVRNAAVGLTFIVDNFTPDQFGGRVAHIRDYRYPGDHFPWQIWSIPADGYDIILPDNSGHGFSQDDIWHEQRALGCTEAQAIRSLQEAQARLDD